MNAQRFKGKVAVVTGGNSGIGLGAAKAYASEGASVVITGRDEKTLQAAAKEIGPGTLAIKSDASKISDIEKMVATIREKFARIDALFVNAGVGQFMPLEQITEAFYNGTFDANVKSVLFTVQKALPLMPSGSAIVLNASINGHKAMPNASVYAASKAAVISLAKNLSIELVGRGIRVNSVSPGPIESALLSRNLSPEDFKQTKEWITSQIPMKRFGKPEDIAAAVLYLTSPESAFVIGADVVVDGGMYTLS
ncbi:MAG: glucose 1-dehydrogenase [Acidobacteriales bacterium]|nr:glucose 1-dehydrogenase [Terriglobales bacterium]